MKDKVSSMSEITGLPVAQENHPLHDYISMQQKRFDAMMEIKALNKDNLLIEAAREVIASLLTDVKQSLRNPDGTPKASKTGKVYNVDAIRYVPMESVRQKDGTTSDSFLSQFQWLLKSVGMGTEEHARATADYLENALHAIRTSYDQFGRIRVQYTGPSNAEQTDNSKTPIPARKIRFSVKL